MKIEDVILPAVLGVVGIWAFQKYVLDPSAAAGKAFAEGVVQPLRTSLLYPGTVLRGNLEGFAAPTVPETPSGYNPSNWTWDVGGGTKLGLPEGMTPGEFCKSSPGAPICAQLGLSQGSAAVPWWNDITLRW